MQWIGYCVAIIQYEWETFYNKLLWLEKLVDIQCELMILNNPLL